MRRAPGCYTICLILFGMMPYLPNAQAGLERGLKLNVDGIERSYDLYVPDQKKQLKRPLVVLYHGHFGSSDVMTGVNRNKAPYKLWLKLAEQNNFLVAIPNGEKGSDDRRGWNDCRADTTTNPETDDVKFTLKLIETIDQTYPVDQSRIYATGASNGGNMVIRLAMEVPEKFAAVAAIIASNPAQTECIEKRKPISVLFMNGTDDPLLPYQGGQVGKDRHERGTVRSTWESVNYWVQVDGTDKTAQLYRYPDNEQTDNSTVYRYTYNNGTNGTEVVLYEIVHGGHTSPSQAERYRLMYRWFVGNQNHDIEMADEVWAFFKDKAKN
jgi:polyhydroxybutyrate depolymerase